MKVACTSTALEPKTDHEPKDMLMQDLSGVFTVRLPRRFDILYV